jgi:hypothetical protein
MPGVRHLLPPPSEADVQRTIRDALTCLGFLVLQTTVRVRRCPQCGKVGAGRYGTSKGIPDLLVRAKNWPPHVWKALEVKGPSTRVSREQQVLADVGAIVIVRSLEDALAALGDAP